MKLVERVVTKSRAKSLYGNAGKCKHNEMLKVFDVVECGFLLTVRTCTHV